MTNPIEKRIRSFVKREGRMTPAQKQAIEQFQESYGLTAPLAIDTFQQSFRQDTWLCLEIGFGNGDTLFHMAMLHPEKDFIGIEVHRPGVGNLLKKVAQQGLTNIKVFNQDAIIVLEQAIPDQSLAEVYLLFPDPWPKARHHKRRILNSDFLKLLAQKMQPNGDFYLATDWQNYAEQMLIELNQSPFFMNAFPDEGYAPRMNERPLTRFEQRGLKLGHSVWDLKFKKRVSS